MLIVDLKEREEEAKVVEGGFKSPCSLSFTTAVFFFFFSLGWMALIELVSNSRSELIPRFVSGFVKDGGACDRVSGDEDVAKMGK